MPVFEIHVDRRHPVNISVIPLGRIMNSMPTDKLHPLAIEVLESYADQSYFTSIHFCREIAKRGNDQCVAWVADVVSNRVLITEPPMVVSKSLELAQIACRDMDSSVRTELDDIAWQTWCIGPYDDSSPYLQRAVSRVCWATIALISHYRNSPFESQYVAIDFQPQDVALQTMFTQCSGAVNMIHARTEGGRLAIASEFTLAMNGERLE